MFKKVSVPLLGLVSNMSTFICPSCNTAHPIFGATDKISRHCDEHGLRLLGEVPLHQAICEDADKGKPTVVREPESERGKVFEGISRKVEGLVGL